MTKLLIVDDSALMRRVFGDVFRAQEGFDVAVARDGHEALELLDSFQPDVITLDVTMPGMDGLACLDRIMVERPCPVIMVSALTDRGADVTLEAMELGAVDFIAKPDGAISLSMDEFGPILVEKVKTAAGAHIRSSKRLAERVRQRWMRSSPTAVPAMPVAPPRSARAPASAKAPGTGVVLVGASTGGPPALDQLLAPLPADFPWPILIAQHMPAAFTGPLARRLDRLCSLAVEEVTRPVPIRPGCVYIGRGDADLIVSKRAAGPVALSAPASSAYRWHPSADRLVETAMTCWAAELMVGVLLTGMGYDGAASMAVLRAGGGRTIAEAEETAVVWGMPGELVRRGGASLVAPMGKIARHLTDWVA